MDIYATQPNWKHNPWIIGLLVIFVFPYGLYLVWKHPTWHARTKWTISGVFAAWIIFAGIIGETEKARVNKKLTEADAQWIGGKKVEAVSCYKILEDKNWSSVKHEMKPMILSRIIEFHAEAGQDDEGQKWIAKANRQGLSITTSSEKATKLLASAKAAEIAAAQRPADEPKPTESPAVKTPAPATTNTGYEMGKEFRLGDYKYKVVSLEMRRQIGEQVLGSFTGEKASPGAVFVIVTYSIENCTKESQTVLSDDFKLMDAQGRTFDTSSKVSTALLMHTEDKDFILSELQPGIPRQMQQGFEVPNESLESNLALVVPKKGLFSFGEARLNVKVR